MTAHSSLLDSRTALIARGAQLVRALGGHWSGSGGMCKCPSHDDGSPSLSIRVGDRNLLYKCFAGCNVSDVIRAINRLDIGTRQLVATSFQASRPNDLWLRQRIRDLWDEARPIDGSPAETYLASRGIALASPALRYHPRTPVKTRLGLIRQPAMLAAVVERGRIVALQRGFLDPALGSLAINIGKPRRMLGRPGRGAVLLAEPDDILGIAEGVETALSAAAMLHIPVWATLGAERLDKIAIPPSVRTLVLLPDNDRAGRAAALAARQAYVIEGRVIETLFPPKAVKDWNELSHRQGHATHHFHSWNARTRAWQPQLAQLDVSRGFSGEWR